MTNILNKYAAEAYAMMRIIAGSLFFFHGSQKLLDFPPAEHQAPPFIMYGAGWIELIGGLLIALGLFTGWAAFISSGEMAAAYWIAHGTKSPLPLVNGGELAALYCFIFLYITTRGAGIWSVDGAAFGAKLRAVGVGSR